MDILQIIEWKSSIFEISSSKWMVSFVLSHC